MQAQVAERAIGKDIKNLLEGSSGETALYMSVIAVMVADVLPTPDDALYFYLQRELRNKFVNNELTPAQYWEREATIYYLVNPIWWGTVLLILASIKGTTMNKLKIFGMVVGAGALVTVIHKNIIKDEKMKQEEEFNKHIATKEVKSGIDGIKIENNSVLNYKNFRIR